MSASINTPPFKFEYTCATGINTPSLSIALVTGNVFGFCLYGALTVQLYIYYITFTEDSKLLKTTIYTVYLIETICTAALAYDLTQLVISPNYAACFASTIISICGSLVALLMQAVYAHRIRILTQKKFIQVCFIVFIAIEVILAAVLISVGVSFYIVAVTWTACCVLADSTIAILMVWSLTRVKIRSGQLRRKIARLLHITVGGGILTVAINLVTLVASVLSLYLTLACGIVLSKIYANSMMVLLNDRKAHSTGEDSTENMITFRTIGSIATVTNATNDESQATVFHHET